MNLFWFYAQPLGKVIAEIILLPVVWAIIMLVIRSKWVRKLLAAVCIVAIMAVILYLTLLKRSGNTMQVVLTPFASFSAARIQPEVYRSMLMNIILFVPLGLGIPFLFPDRIKHKVLWTVLIGLSLSVCIEVAQYLFSFGICETDDVIMNTTGALIGATSYPLSLLFMKLWNKYQDKLKDYLKRKVREITGKRNVMIGRENQALLGTVGCCLFAETTPEYEHLSIGRILAEAHAQSVFAMVYSVLTRNDGSSNTAAVQQNSERWMQISIRTLQNFQEHGELHELMTSAGIPYVVIKGLSSAMYYPEPSLRMMGDVDFLIHEEDMTMAGRILEKAGFAVDHGEESDSMHIAYTRPPQSVWEMHRTVNGIPAGEVGELIRQEIDNAIDTAILTEVDGVICRVPDKPHHGLILLLHTASHLTSEGVGLRHLCDWVVFASSMSDGEFRSIFEEKLKRFGLWRFAQILTLLGIRYLGAPERAWASEALDSNSVDEAMLEGLMEDILSGGNFGKKDMNRYREIKYISDRGEKTVHSRGILSQGMKSLNKKVYSDYVFINKNRLLLPIGWVAEGGKYAKLLITGKRKSSDTGKMLKEASQRKKLYASLHLFDAD